VLVAWGREVGEGGRAERGNREQERAQIWEYINEGESKKRVYMCSLYCSVNSFAGLKIIQNKNLGKNTNP